MSRPLPSLVIVVAALMSSAGSPLAAQDTASDVTVAKDLTAVIALQGKSCGQVVSVRRLGEDDYIASCEDGNRYRVFVNPDGRVIVEKVD